MKYIPKLLGPLITTALATTVGCNMLVAQRGPGVVVTEDNPPAPPARIHRVVYVDADFTKSELQAIIEGARLWEKPAPRGLLSFEIMVLPHAQVMRLASRGSVNAARVTGRDVFETVCPYAIIAIMVACTAPDSPNLYLAPSLFTITRMPMVFAHELGHAMGLGHLPNPTIMAPLVDWMELPTAQDVEALKKAQGL